MYLTRSAFVALGLGGAALLAGACAGSGYRFVENDEYGVYAKVPDDWTVFENDEVLEAVTGRSSESGESEVLQPRIWINGFDAGGEPTAERVIEPGSEEPRGYVQVVQLTREERDQINLSSLRGFVVGSDPLSTDPLAGQGSNAQVLTDEPAEFDGGYHGLHTVIVTQPSGSGDPIVIDQTALLNSDSSVLYLLVVSCAEDCYFETSRDEIAEIVDSWAIQEDGS